MYNMVKDTELLICRSDGDVKGEHLIAEVLVMSGRKNQKRREYEGRRR